MKYDVITLDNGQQGTIELDESIFGLDVRADILHRVVRWQRARAQAGTHKVKTRSETSYSRHKIHRQKGTGGARHGDRNAPIFRKGGVYKGPTPRSQAHGLPKKIRCLGLKHALSAKAKDDQLVILNNTDIDGHKTQKMASFFKERGWKRVLIIDGAKAAGHFAQSIANLKNVHALPAIGANVYDILKNDILIITRSAVELLEERLK